MKLLDQFKKLSETDAGCVAGAAMPLFSTLTSMSSKRKLPLRKTKTLKRSLGIKEAFDDSGTTKEAPLSSIDQSAVTANLKKLERKETVDRKDCVAFGLTDDDGKTIKVWIKRDQASDFERELSGFVADREHSEDNKDIGEMLFMMRNQFDIVDVEWPEIEEDEEQQTEIASKSSGDGTDDGGEFGELGDDANGMGADADMGAASAMPDPAQGVLQQVIDMMKADAEARKAEAEARKAEARTKEADLAVKQAMQKVKQEEQFLDMEEFDKAQKQQSKESRRLAQLARWKKQMNGGDQGGAYEARPEVSRESEEEECRQPMRQPKPSGGFGRRVTPSEVASFIVGRIK